MTNKPYKYRWVILAIYMYVAALTQLYWLNFAAIPTYIEKHFNLPSSQLVWLSLVFVIIMPLATIPAGIFIDKKGFKWGVGLGVTFLGIFALVRLINPDSFRLLLIGQIGIALGEPFIINGVTKLAVLWFPKEEEATAIGLGSLALFVGMMIALGATPWIVNHLSFDAMIFIYGIMGILGTLLFLLFVKSDPPSTHSENQQIRNWGGIKNILKEKNFLILSAVAFFGISVFNGLIIWFEKILHDEHHLSLISTANISAALMLSGIIGCIVIPYFSDKAKNRKLFLIANLIVIISCIIYLIFAKSVLTNLINAIILGFFLLSSLPLILTMSAEITGPQYTGISVGFLQLIGNAGGTILILLIEVLRDTSRSYTSSLILMSMLIFLALLLLFKLKGTYPTDKMQIFLKDS